MTSTAHLNALERKHAALEAEVFAESRRPMPDAAALAALKKKKLQLKDAIGDVARR